ncbi:MBL fold metallo-hydrolase [Spirillospora sp. CA-294931]|uniref:MBL fold metallo-hydrolase n=1 Tax=Spirillospora sp. CA-294931 TaxID=3240042 RepID=UPI003D8A7549
MESSITPLGGDVYEIDTRMAGYSGITAGYLILSDRPCLVEPGTAGSVPVVRQALSELGIGPSDLATVVVTHIHLDHAGGVGDIAELYPDAEVVVHEKGARHLASPERLMRSARMVYGDKLDVLFGELKPTEASRIRSVEESGVIDLGGGRRLESHHSPGHAKHHVGLVDSQTGDLYVGDAAGLYIPETADVRPATPPPDFDLELTLRSLDKFRALGPQRLLFAHYGPVDEVDDTLLRSAEELRIWVDTVRDARDQSLDLDHAVAMVRERTLERYAVNKDPELAAKYEVLSGAEANVAGIMHSLDQGR